MAAGVLCAALAMATAVRLPVFFGADERTHFGYVVYVIEGRLPEVRDPLPTADERFPILARAQGLDRVPEEHVGPFLNTANHPPLLYVTAALPTWLAGHVGDETLPPLVVRLLNGMFMGAGAALTGLLARQLFPRVARVGMLAAGLAAVTPNVVGVAAYGHNDGLAFTLAVGALLVMARLLRQGPTSRLVIASTAVAVACALTRASLTVASIGLVAAAVLGGLRQHRAQRSAVDPPAADAVGDPIEGEPGPRWWRRPAWWPWVAGALVAGSVVVLAGWFYVRNQRLYGSPTADDLLLDAFQRVPRGSLGDVLTGSELHREMWTKLYGSVHPEIVFSAAELVVVALVAVALLGGLVALWSGRLRISASGRPDGIGAVGWLLLAAYGAAVIVSVGDFVSKGGSMHPRYFFALVPLTSTLLAGAIAALPWRRVVGVLAVGGLLAVTLSQLRGYEALIERRARAGSLVLPDRPAGPPIQWALLGLAALAATVLLGELWRAPTPGCDVSAEEPVPEATPAGADRSAVRLA